MKPKKTREDLWAATAEAARKQNTIGFRPDPSPCPGDTYVFHHAADVPIEWAIVERDQQDARRLRVVPLDAYPQIGSHDLGLHLSEPGRVANIRCDLDTWLEASRFEQDHRTGILPIEGLAAIQHKRAAIDSGELEATLLEEKVDGDPEYRRWKDETLSTALAELNTDEDRLAEPQPVQLPAVQPPQRFAWPSASLFYAVAATAVLAFGAFWSLRQVGDLQEQLLDRDRRIATVTEELDQARTSMEEQLTEAGQEVEQLRAEIRGMTDTSEELARSQSLVARLRGSLASSPAAGVLANLPVSFLRGGRTRGEHLIDIPEGAPRVALVVEVIDAEPYDRYRLEILDHEKESDNLIWQSDRLLRRGSVLSLSLPSALFAQGYYDLNLYGIDDAGEEKKLEESYLMKVRLTSSGR